MIVTAWTLTADEESAVLKAVAGYQADTRLAQEFQECGSTYAGGDPDAYSPSAAHFDHEPTVTRYDYEA